MTAQQLNQLSTIRTGTVITAGGETIEILGADQGMINGKFKSFWHVQKENGWRGYTCPSTVLRMLNYPGAVVTEPKALEISDDELLAELVA